MGRTGEVEAGRVVACLFVLGAHLLFWWVLTLASRGPGAGRGDALQVIWIEPAEQPPPVPPDAVQRPTASGTRSEEHTSELQSLMRISYAVFCLKKKNTI